MLRMTVFAVSILTLLAVPAGRSYAYEMEGLLDCDAACEKAASLAIVPVKSQGNVRYASLSPPTNVEASPTQQIQATCDMPDNVVRIRRVELCGVTPSQSDSKIVSTSIEKKIGGFEKKIDASSDVPGHTIRYRILIEKGLEDQANHFVTRVKAILNSETGWARNGVRFVRVTQGYKLTVLLAQPQSVNRLCRPLRTGGWLSCAMQGRAIINVDRWRGGAKTWGSDVAGYHHYLINHEVGHVLGMHHVGCPKAGEPAPIMLPQTKFLKGCTANGIATTQDLALFRRAVPYLRRRTASAHGADAGEARPARRKYRRRAHYRHKSRSRRRRRH